MIYRFPFFILEMSTLLFPDLAPWMFFTPLKSSSIRWMFCCLFILFLSLIHFFMCLLTSFTRCSSSLGGVSSLLDFHVRHYMLTHTVTIKPEGIIYFLCALLFSGSHLMLRHFISGWDLQNLRTVTIRCRATPDSAGPVEFLVGNLLRSGTLLFANSSHPRFLVT